MAVWHGTLRPTMNAFGWWAKVLVSHNCLAKHSPLVHCAGSFGMAVLYRRKEDDSFVILQEINLHELGPSERQVA